MSDRKAIEARIAELRGELGRVEGRPTEVYSRIVGYYRSVRNWNAGKRSEYSERRSFAMPEGVSASPGPEKGERGRDGEAPSAAASSTGRAAARAPDDAELDGLRDGVFVFTRHACPNCSPVTNYIMGEGVPAVFVDVDRDEGLELARLHGVLSTPTVLSLDPEGRELFRALDLGQLKSRLATARA